MFKSKDAVTSHDGNIAFQEYSKKIHRGALLTRFSTDALVSFIDNFTGNYLILTNCIINEHVLRQLNNNLNILRLILDVTIESNVTYLELPPNLVYLDIQGLFSEHLIRFRDVTYIQDVRVGHVDSIKLLLLKKIKCNTLTITIYNHFDAVFVSTVKSDVFIMTTTPRIACYFLRLFEKNTSCNFEFYFTNPQTIFQMTSYWYVVWKFKFKSKYYYIK